jgi:hypothetical protein
LKAPHSKCGIRVTVSGVRIPPSPPAPLISLANSRFPPQSYSVPMYRSAGALNHPRPDCGRGQSIAAAGGGARALSGAPAVDRPSVRVPLTSSKEFGDAERVTVKLHGSGNPFLRFGACPRNVCWSLSVTFPGRRELHLATGLISHPYPFGLSHLDHFINRNTECDRNSRAGQRIGDMNAAKRLRLRLFDRFGRAAPRQG